MNATKLLLLSAYQVRKHGMCKQQRRWACLAEDGRESVPLHEAAEWGHRDITRALIDAAARIDAHNRFGESPLLLAARGGFSDVVEVGPGIQRT